jgi:dTDP-glucose 4,6-dehydratase
MENKTVLITGGCGFVGHHMVEHILKNTMWKIIILDKLSYASMGYDRLRDIEIFPEKQDRVKLFPVDLVEPISIGVTQEIGEVNYIIHLAAESHVDDSIDHPTKFIKNNVNATLNILEFARTLKYLEIFINFSTDEVFGFAPKNFKFPEFYYHNPSNPYSASKSAQEAIGIAYSNTYKVPVITTHTMNIFGERQHPQKFIPMIIKKLLLNEKIIIHSNKDKTESGTRFYLHARNLSEAIMHILKIGYSKYDEWNIAGIEEVSNLKLAEIISKIVDKNLRYEMVDFHSSRPGHDLRYALDSMKLINSGFQYQKTFLDSLEKTVYWFLNNLKWLGL